MKGVALFTLILALGLVSGCVHETLHTGEGRYQIAGDGQGHFMKIDTQTGKAWSTGGATWADWYPVPDK